MLWTSSTADLNHIVKRGIHAHVATLLHSRHLLQVHLLPKVGEKLSLHQKILTDVMAT